MARMPPESLGRQKVASFAEKLYMAYSLPRLAPQGKEM